MSKNFLSEKEILTNILGMSKEEEGFYLSLQIGKEAVNKKITNADILEGKYTK